MTADEGETFAMEPVRVGIVGCGTISGIYLKNSALFKSFDVVACADMVPARAAARAEEFGVPKACSVDDLLADPAVELVLNLTVPAAHAEVALRAVEAGKSVYGEKPLTVSRDDGQRLLALAAERGVRVGCAPDTFLGGGIQTCCKLIDDGWIGQPVAASAFFTSHGPEGWHPDPDFYFQPGAGPLFDMGPYYLTALVALLGPVHRVSGMARVSFPERVITSQAKYGQRIQVNTPTHVTGSVEFASGALGTILTSFDVWNSTLPRIEIYGSLGSLLVPDPNTFRGPVRYRRAGADDWSDVPLTHGYTENSRGVGVADMAAALRSGRPHRASGALAYHVLDCMHAFLDTARTSRHVRMRSTCPRPAPLPLGLRDWEMGA
jgi:predicted dehydrogenase